MTYSQDLRLRVNGAVRAKQQSLSQIAKVFGVSESTVDQWAKRWRTTRRVAALPWAGGVKRRLRTCAAAIRAEVKKQPDATLAELCTRVEKVTKVASGPSLMSRELRLLKLPRKKRASTTASGRRRA